MSQGMQEINELTHAVIGAAIEVHRHLGPGLGESLYEQAMRVELQLQNIPYECQRSIALIYKGQAIGHGRLDLLIDSRLVVELKAVDTLMPVHEGQVLTYLKAGGYKLGLLINFNVPRLRDGIKRLIHS